MIQHPLEIPRAIHEAFHIARTGRPGPVVVDIPPDLSRADIPYEPVDRRPPARLPADDRRQPEADPPGREGAGGRAPAGDLRRRRRRQRRTRRAELVELATADRFPVTCTLMGLGAFPAPHDAVARDARDARHAHGELRDGRGRPDRARSARASTTASPASVASSRRGRSSSTSTSTRPRSPRTCRRTSRSSATRSNILAKLVGRVPRAGGRPVRGSTSGGSAIRALAGAPPAALRGLDRRRDQAAVHGPGAVRGDRRRRDRHLATSASTRCGRRSTSTSTARAAGSTPAASGTMGFGLPAAMGAKVGCPDETVVCIAGDGSVQMNMQELATCAQEGIADQGVHHEQRLPRHGPPVAGAVLGPAATRRSTWASYPDFVKLAEAYGATGMRFDGQDDARRRHARRRSRPPGPVVVDVARHARGERVSDDRARPGRAGHGGVSAMGEPGTKELLQPRGARGRRPACAPGASTSSRSSSRTSRAS